MFLYHICRSKDKGDLSRGYVGVSKSEKSLNKRWKDHRSGRTNEHLKNAYAKYDDIIEYAVAECSTVSCLLLEVIWRPFDGIGWNVAKGGGLPLGNGKGRGKPRSQSCRDKISAKAKGRPSPFKGVAGLHTHSDESKAKMSDTRRRLGIRPPNGVGIKKGHKYERVTCPYCGKDGSGGNMKRYHFDNCKAFKLN